MNDLNKSRIELLRDAMKDAADTVRAQDRKASYMIAIVFFLITTFSVTTHRITGVEDVHQFTQILYFFPLIYLLTAVGFLLISYNPISNPTDVLTSEDLDLGKDTFFIHYQQDKAKSSTVLVQDFYKKTQEFSDLARILYIEILILSKIRDTKIKHIKTANIFLFSGLVYSALQLASFYNFSLNLLGLSAVTSLIAWVNFKRRSKSWKKS